MLNIATPKTNRILNIVDFRAKILNIEFLRSRILNIDPSMMISIFGVVTSYECCSASEFGICEVDSTR